MRRYYIFYLVISILLITSCASFLGKKDNSEFKASNKEDNRTILIVLSADGFRADYINKHYCKNIDSIIQVGSSGYLKPSYPSQTFPNHYTLATGLYPDHHGIIANQFYDSKLGEYRVGQKSTLNADFYQGEPIWNTAQKQGKKAAVYFWVGSEAKVNGEQAYIWHKYNSHTPFKTRADELFKEINKGDIDLAMLYIEQPDKAGHSYGPNSNEVKAALLQVDKFIGYILRQIKQSPYKDNIDFMLVSDHGMTEINRQIRLLDYIDEKDIEHCYTGSLVNLYLKDNTQKDNILDKLNHIEGLRAYAKNNIPKELHYGTNTRVGDILIIPELGTYVYYDIATSQKGTHGYNNNEKDMRAIFAAFGKDFSKNKKIHRAIENVNIYPLMCKLLNIKASNNDGNIEVVEDILQNK